MGLFIGFGVLWHIITFLIRMISVWLAGNLFVYPKNEVFINIIWTSLKETLEILYFLSYCNKSSTKRKMFPLTISNSEIKMLSRKNAISIFNFFKEELERHFLLFNRWCLEKLHGFSLSLSFNSNRFKKNIFQRYLRSNKGISNYNRLRKYISVKFDSLTSYTIEDNNIIDSWNL